MAVAFKKDAADCASIGGGWSRAACYMVICAYARCTAVIHSPAHKYLPIAKNALYAHYGTIFVDSLHVPTTHRPAPKHCGTSCDSFVPLDIYP